MQKGLVTSLALGVLLAGVSSVSHATMIAEVEPNDTLATAQNVDGSFSLDFAANIENSTTIPHVSIQGTGNNGTTGTYDWFTFTVSGTGNNSVLLDIDYGWDGDIFDSIVRLYNSSGTELAMNDDTSSLDLGSTSNLDSWLLATSLAAGSYYVKVGDYALTEMPISEGRAYTLNISVDNQTAPVPEPATMMLMGTGLAGLAAARRRKA